jgi:hypothetical protein
LLFFLGGSKDVGASRIFPDHHPNENIDKNKTVSDARATLFFASLASLTCLTSAIMNVKDAKDQGKNELKIVDRGAVGCF